MSVDKEALFKARVPEAEVEVDGLGTVRVRGLSRGEVFASQQAKGTAAMERQILAFGLLDPQLTVAEAGRWQEASPAGELEPVVDRIRELSGLSDTAVKEAVKAFAADPDAEFRDVPSSEAEHDGGADAPGDAER